MSRLTIDIDNTKTISVFMAKYSCQNNFVILPKEINKSLVEWRSHPEYISRSAHHSWRHVTDYPHLHHT